MYAEDFPGCCALRVLVGASCAGKADAWSKREAEKVNTMHEAVCWSSAALLTITDFNKVEFRRAKALLRKKGWKLLGSSPKSSGEPDHDGEYRVYLFGSKEFKKPK